MLLINGGTQNRPGPRIELAEDACDVGLDRGFGDEQLLTDRGVRLSAGQQREDFELSFSEARLLYQLGCPPVVCAEVLDNVARRGLCEQRRSVVDHTDRAQELGLGCILEEETAGASSECAVDVLVHVERRDHQNLRRLES